MGFIREIRRDVEQEALCLMREYRSLLLAEAKQLTNDDSVAEDLVMKTIESYLAQPDEGLPANGKVRAWLRTTLRNHFNNSVRGKARACTVYLDEEDAARIDEIAPADNSSDEAILAHSDAELVRNVLARLPKSARSVIVMHYFESLTICQIAELLRKSPDSVKSNLYYARKVLAKRLGKMMGRAALAIAALLFGGSLLYAAAVATGLAPSPFAADEESEVVFNAKSTEDTEDSLTGLTGFTGLSEAGAPHPSSDRLRGSLRSGDIQTPNHESRTTNHETQGDSPQQTEAITASSDTNTGENAMNTQSVKSAAVKTLAAGAMLAACAAFGETLDPTLFRRSAVVSTSYTQSSTLTNFPLLVRISSDRLPGFNASTAGENGMGVRFADAEGTLLNHEIDEFHADGDSLYWVSVPRLRSGAKLTVYWDPLPGAELPAVSASTVWDCADYVAVWHFNDTNLTNSASTEMPIAYGANCVVSNDAGQAGLCLWRDKGLTVDDYLNHGVNRAHWTWSMWIKWANHTASVQKNYITKGGWVASNGGWFTEFKKTDRTMGLFSGQTSIGFGTVIAVNWNHIAMSYDGSTIRTFVNGSASTTRSGITIQDGSYNFYMGSCGNTFQDELRIRNAVSTPDWMNAEKSQQSNLQYVTFSVNPLRRERVQLDTTQFLRSAGIRASGYTGTATLTNFPFLVRLSSARLPGFDPADAGDGGANLRFADLDGTLLAHDVDEWNPEGESIIWVSVPEFKPGTAIALYWDPKPGAELPAVVPSDVWDVAGYCGVWHCGDKALADASSAAIPASYATGAAISNDVAFAGRGIRRDGAVTIADYLYRGVGFTHWSVSGWFQWPSHTADAQYNYLNKGNYNNRQGWFTEYKQSLTAHTLAYGTGSQASTMSFGTMTATDWNHIAVAYDGATVVCYVNGYQVSSKALTIGNGQYDLFLRASVNAGMDEVRVRNAASSAGWINAEKEMTADPDFATFLAEVPDVPVESLGPQFAGRFNCKVRITMPGYVSEAVETNFPMLVRLSRGNPKSFDPAACGAGGGDLRFFDEEGNLLPHEVDEWNPAGESLVWVLVPELTTNAAVVMCWAPREGGAVPAPDPGLVWARSGYKAVWHFASAGASMPNSAFGSMPMTPVDAAAASNAAGKVGQALSKGTTVSSPDYYVHNVPGEGPYSVSFWMKIPNLTASDFYQPVQKGVWQNGWLLEVRNNVTQPRICYNSYWTAASGSVDMREWHYFAFSYLSNQASFYYDGTYQSLNWGAVSANPAAFLLCNNGACNEQFDEVRVRAEKTSSARQSVEIANMTDPAFLAFEIMRDAGTVIYLK